MLPLPIALAETVNLATGIIQFLVVVGLSYGGILLLVSFLRFQQLTGRLELPLSEEDIAHQTANQFQAELLRRLRGGRGKASSLMAVYVGLLDNDALSRDAGEAGVQEALRWVQEVLIRSIRKTDVVLRMDDGRIGVILSGCTRERGLALARRLQDTLRAGLCRTSGGWSGFTSSLASVA